MFAACFGFIFEFDHLEGETFLVNSVDSSDFSAALAIWLFKSWIVVSEAEAYEYDRVWNPKYNKQ